MTFYASQSCVLLFNLDIPQGTLNKSFLRFRCLNTNGGSGDLDCWISGGVGDTLPATAEEMLGIERTEARAHWIRDTDLSGGEYFDSPDISCVLKDPVLSGTNDVLIFIEHYVDCTLSRGVVECWALDDYAVELHVFEADSGRSDFFWGMCGHSI